MATPRHQLVDPNTPLCYHLVSRCVRRGWLCGYDRTTKRDYTHRKEWLEERLKQLGRAFAIDIYAYAIMSNHFHLVVYYDPKAPERWSDLEVAERWFQVCPPRLPDGSVDNGRKQFLISELVGDQQKLTDLRKKLGSLSLFMKFLKQPIARRANIEDECEGHFFDQRFYSGALLSVEAMLAAMAYVDLNPVRAKIARTIAECDFTSIDARLRAVRTPEDLDLYLAPVIAGLNSEELIPAFTLSKYVKQLELLIGPPQKTVTPNKFARWRQQVASLQKKQRAYGSITLLTSWVSARGLQLRESPLPD